MLAALAVVTVAVAEPAGPTQIDVSGYPEPLQHSYELFRNKCSDCHKLTRAITSPEVLPDEMARSVGRMTRKRRANITAQQAAQILDFLIYDAAVRKATLLQQRLQTLPGEQRQQAEQRIRDVRARYEKPPAKVSSAR